MDWVDGVVVLSLLLFVVFCFTRFSLPKEGESKAGLPGSTRRRDEAQGRRNLPRVAAKSALRQRLGLGRRVRSGNRSINVEAVPAPPPALPLSPAAALQRPVLAKVDLQGLDGLGQIRALDPTFDDKRFLKKAGETYQAFYKAWNKGDEAALGLLCAPRLRDELLGQLDTAAETGKGRKITLTGPVGTELVDGRVHGRTAIVVVDFTVLQQTDDGASQPQHSRWTLARALTSEDPVWEVQTIVPAAA